MPPFSFGGGVASAPTDLDDTWSRADLTDGTWTLNDPDSTVSNLSVSGGVHSVDITSTANTSYIDGAVWWKEVKKPQGGDFDFSTSPVFLQSYIHWPSTGWRDTSDPPQSGGENQPPVGSRCYTLTGYMTDPENLPTSGITPIPKDIVGCGLEWLTSLTQSRRVIIRNVSTASPNGVLDYNTTGLDNINSDDVAAGHKCVNRMYWHTYITKAETLGGAGLDVAGSPRSRVLIYFPRYDNGDKYQATSYSLDQRWGRTRTTKLYQFVAVGRQSSGGAALTMKFDCYFKALMLNGNNPSGTTGL